ncbi:MAG: hypothetical protein AAFP23_08695 [Pseudomonadota bacterium]
MWIALLASLTASPAALAPAANPTALPTAAHASPAPLAAPTNDGPPTVEWRGDDVQFGSLAETLAKAGIDKTYAGSVAAQFATLTEWAAEHDYTAAMTDDARVVLFAYSESRLKKRMKELDKAIAAFDEAFTPPDRSDSKEKFHGKSGAAGHYRPDAKAAILVELKKNQPYRELVYAVGEDDDTPAQDWVATMAEKPGFCEGRFGVAGWEIAPAGFEVGDVWRTENELCNRVGRLLLYRHFGPQPTWFDVATGWIVEEAVMGDIYSFPYRYEFVGIGEHTGWKSELKRAFKKRKKEPLEMSELTRWKRNTWDDRCAALAWGMMTYLQATAPESLGQIAEAQRLTYKTETITESVDKAGRHSWAYTPVGQIQTDSQQTALVTATQESILEDASTFFRTWKLPKKSRVRTASTKSRR